MRLLNSFKKHRITNDNWAFYHEYDEDENIGFISIDMTYKNPISQTGFQSEFFIRIKIPDSRLFDNLPIPEEQEFQILMEEKFCKRLVKSRVNCMQVSRLTTAGQKQYVFECNDVVEFNKEFKIWKDSFNKDYHVELNELSSFEYYSELLPDKYINQQFGNQLLINKLESVGSDMNKEHFIEHGISGNFDNLQIVSDAVKEYDFTIINLNHNLLEVGTQSLLDIYIITDQTDYLIDLCDRYNCQYDGWLSAPIK